MFKKLPLEVVQELLARLKEGQPIVLLRRVFRSGDTTYEPLPRLLAEMVMACIPECESDVARAKIIPLGSPEASEALPGQVGVQEVNAKNGKAKAPIPAYVLVPERVGLVH